MKIRDFPRPLAAVLAHAKRVYSCTDDAERNVARATELTNRLDHEAGAAWLETLLKLYGLFATWYQAVGQEPDELDESRPPSDHGRDEQLAKLREAVRAQRREEIVALTGWFVAWYAHWLLWKYNSDGRTEFDRYASEMDDGSAQLLGVAIIFVIWVELPT
jgi:hypothetical protein